MSARGNECEPTEKDKMANEAMKKRRAPVRGKKLDPRITSWVRDKVNAIGLDDATTELVDCIRTKCHTDHGFDARGQIKTLLADPNHRFQSYWHTFFGVWSGALGNVVEVPTLEQFEVPEDEIGSGVFKANALTPMRDPEPFRGTNPSATDAEIGASLVFYFGNVQVRTAGTATDPLFCAADVCSALGIGNVSDACSRLDQDEQELVSVESISGRKHALFVTEPGLYRLICGSRKEEAKRFDRWVRHDVLPRIRKTGSYTAPGSAPQLPPAAIDYQAMSTSIATAVSLAVVRAMHEILPRRSPRARYVSPAQQTIPQTMEQPKPVPVPVPTQDPKQPVTDAPVDEPTQLQRLRASGLASCTMKPGKVESRDVPGAIKAMVDAVAAATGWKHSDLYVSVYRGILTETGWDPRKKAANVGTALKHIGSQSCERKLACYRVAYDVLIGQHLK